MRHWTMNGFRTPTNQGAALDDMFGQHMSNYEAVCYNGKSIVMYEYDDEDHTTGQRIVWSEPCNGDNELYRQRDEYLSTEHGNW